MQYRYLDMVFKELFFSEINWQVIVLTKIIFVLKRKVNSSGRLEKRACQQSLPKIAKRVSALHSNREGKAC